MAKVQKTLKRNSKTALTDQYLKPRDSRQNREEEYLVMWALNSGMPSLRTWELRKTGVSRNWWKYHYHYLKEKTVYGTCMNKVTFAQYYDVMLKKCAMKMLYHIIYYYHFSGLKPQEKCFKESLEIRKIFDISFFWQDNYMYLSSTHKISAILLVNEHEIQ